MPALQQISKTTQMGIFNKIPHNSSFLLLLTITFLLTPATQTSMTSKLVLTQVENEYALNAEIGGQQVKIMAHLSDQLDWVKADDCLLCEIVEGEKKSKDGEACQQSCYGEDEKGVKCVKSYCKKLKQQNGNLPYYIEQGEKAELKIKQKSSGTKLAYKTILATKMSEKIPENGRLNLLNGQKGLFGNQLILAKDHAKDITIYYYSENQTETEAESIVNQMIPLYSDINIIQKDPNLAKQLNNKKGEISGLILEGTKSKAKSDDAKSADEEESGKDEKDQDEQTEQDAEVNIFDITEIKVKQMFKLQSNNIQSEKTEKQKNQFLSSIPLQKSTAEFSIKTNKLLLPASIFKKFTSQILDKYFSDPASPSQSCQFQQGLLTCSSKQILKIEQLDNVTITLVLNNLQIQFPIRALIETCRQKSCVFSLGISKTKKSIIIGDFILNIFALQYNKKLNHFVMYRLNNQWAQNFVKFRKIYSHQANFMWMFIVFLFKAIMWVLKAIGFLSLVVLGLNCLYHWREVMEWFIDLCSKLSNKRLREELKDEKLKSLGKNINKMSVRIKDRLNKNFMKASKFRELPEHSSGNFDEQITLSQQIKRQSTKLMSLEELSDPSSAQQDQHGHENMGQQKGNFKREAILKQIQKEKEDLQKKMSTRGELPEILKSMPKPKQVQIIPEAKQTKAQPHNQKTKQAEVQEQFYEFEMNQHQFNQF